MGAATRVDAVPITGLFDTGVDGSGNPLPAGAIDPHYKLIASDDPAFPGPNALVTTLPLPDGWTPNATTDQWISPNTFQTPPDTGGQPPPVGNALGTYVYDLPFDLTGLNPQQASIRGAWAVDSIGLIFLNGMYVDGTTNLNEPDAFTTFHVPVGANFASGINHLDFIVINQKAGGSTGLRVEGVSGDSPQIPEPAGIVLGGIGFVGLVAPRWCRGRKSCARSASCAAAELL